MLAITHCQGTIMLELIDLMITISLELIQHQLNSSNMKLLEMKIHR